MSNGTSKPPATFWPEAGVAGYSAVCMVATGVILVALQMLGLDSAAMFPVLAGLLGVATRWNSTPLLLLITLAMCLSLGQGRWMASSPATGLRMVDVILCSAVLAYLLAFYRLQCVWKLILPPRPSLVDPDAPVEPIKRPGRLIDSQELGWLLLSLPVWAALAQVCWALMPKESEVEVLIAPAYQAMFFVWVSAMVGLTAAGVLDYLRRSQMTRDEALLYLQDEVWHETRREQRQYNRWLAWDNRDRPSYLLPTLAVLAAVIAFALVVILLI